MVKNGNSFPGWWAILPTIGCCFVISAGPSAWINKHVLSNKSLNFLGKISFPLYLWHWPLLTFARLLEFNSFFSNTLCLILSFILSALTFHYVENPARRRNRRKVAVSLFLAMCMVALSAFFLIKHDGIPSRFERPEIFDTNFATSWRQLDCFVDGIEFRDFSPTCVDPKTKNETPLIVIWGDSHAAHLYPGFLALQKESLNIRIAQFTTSSCPPLLNFSSTARKECSRNNLNVLEKIKDIRPNVVILAADWMDESYDIDRIHDTVKELNTLQIDSIWLTGTVPRWPMPLPRYLLNIMRKSSTHEVPNRLLPMDTSKKDEELKKAALTLGIEYFSPKDALCNAEGCLTNLMSNNINRITQFDICHLTDEGSLPVARKYQRRIGISLKN